MIKKLCFWCVLAAASTAAWAQQVTGVSYNPASLSHSQVQISFTSSGWVGTGSPQLRVRYIAAPGTCTAMSGGTVQGNQAPQNASPSYVDIGGLTPNTTYNICPEISTDGANWFGGVSVSVTTLPLPAIHPVPPAPPATFSTDYPDTTGYTVVNAANDCSDWQSDLYTAVQNRAAHGTIINLPPGVACSGFSEYFLPIDPDVHTFASSAVAINPANTITLPTSIAEGTMIRFGASHYGNNLPGGSGCCGNVTQSGPIISGMPYYVHCPSSSPCSTIQVYSCPTSVLDGTTPTCSFAQGTLAVLTNQGSGNLLTYVTEPRSPNWIIVRTATPDSQFVPPGSRVQGPMTTDGITPDLYPSPPTQWAPKMAIIQSAISELADGAGTINISCNNCNEQQMLTNIRFVGIEFNRAADPYAYTSSDPKPWDGWVITLQESQNIIFDRCWFHNNGTPDRLSNGLQWNGMNEAIIDSYIDGAHYWHGFYTGLGISQLSSTTYSIAAGSAHFGAGSGSLASAATISISGAPSGQNRIFNYFTMSGNQLNVVLPPGVTGTASGDSNIHIVTGVSRGSSSLTYPTSGVFPPTGSPNGGYGGDNYFVDPVFSTSSSCSNTTTLFSALNPSVTGAYASYTQGVELGTTFYSSVSGYVCGVRFYKSAADTGTTTGSLWSAAGTQLATGTFGTGTSTGWQSLQFSSPVAITANTAYVISYHTNTGFYFGHAFWENSDYINGPLYANAYYIASNESCNYTDSWPQDSQSRPAAGEIACVDVNSSGSIIDVGNADLNSSQFNSEGSQVMVGGLGPGPYIYRGNYLECSGNCWHHDDGGGFWDPSRYDYTYYRNYWRMPAYTWLTGPYSDGLHYGSRHFLEWKAGSRISIKGNIFNRNYTDETPTDDSVELSGKSVSNPPSDIDIESNTFMHSPGALMLGGPQESTCCQTSIPEARTTVRNNLAYDIDSNYCLLGSGFACPTGGWFTIGIPGEDTMIDHNTILLNGANPVAVLVYQEDIAREGVQVTNNFIVGNAPRYSATVELINQDTCYPYSVGESAVNCKWTPSYVWTGNVFLGAGVTASQMKAQWPNHTANNYFVAETANNGWFSFNSANPSLGGDFHLNANYCSGCGSAAGDGKDVGADIDVLEAAQGKVTLIGIPASTISSTTATVSFVAPDAQGCPVDYSNIDQTLVNNFTRVADPGGSSRVRNIVLTGLSSGTTYYYRVDCEVQQPTGRFRTN